MQAAQQAEATGITVRGIKGTSVLASTLDLVDGIPIDYMHAVLEGVTKWLLNARFKSQNHREAFYLGRSVNEIDTLLLKQRPPSEFSRPPRSIRDTSVTGRHQSYAIGYSSTRFLSCLGTCHHSTFTTTLYSFVLCTFF